MTEKNVRVALAAVLEELTGKPPRLSCAHENSGEWSRCDLIFEPTRIGYRNPKGGASAGSTVWHSWVTTPAARVPLIACGAVVSVEVAPAHTITPAEAVESLYVRDVPLWAWSPGDDAAPRWWCGWCDGGSPTLGALIRCETQERGDGVVHCAGFAEPHSLASFVAVASLGVPTLRNAYGLAAQLVGRAPRVTFRVMAREALREHHRKMGRRYTSTEWSITAAFSRAAIVDTVWPDVCPEALPRERRGRSAAGAMLGDGVSTASDLAIGRARDAECLAAIHRAWPVLRDLHSLGVHLVAIDGDRITLVVEAIGNDR
jgi:hypothetical protein